MRTCKETAALMSKAERTRLSTAEWFALHLHLLICSLCRGHRRNNRILSRAIRLLLSRRSAFQTLPATARQRIATALKHDNAD
jgi:hypothetical protein